MEKIISEIKDGKWFVSMECLFAGFDYALVNPEGEAQVVARGEDSAFLTKHLRAYGGNGEYEGYKLGRALNNISFSGKGLVAKPANPRSVILNSKSTAQFKTNDINSNLIIGEKHMSDTMLLEKQLAEVQGELSSAKAENQAIKAKIEEAKDKEFASTVEAFEASADESQATISELEESIKSTQARVAELEDSLTTSENELAEAVKKVDEMKKKEEMNMRKEKMADAGFNEEEIEESMAGFESLSEDAFDVIVAMMKKKVKKKEEEAIRKPMASEEDAEAAMPPALKEAIEKKKKEKEEKDAKASDEEEVTAEHFEGVESTEATLIDSEDVVDEIESTRASVADWFANNVLSK